MNLDKIEKNFYGLILVAFWLGGLYYFWNYYHEMKEVVLTAWLFSPFIYVVLFEKMKR